MVIYIYIYTYLSPQADPKDTPAGPHDGLGRAVLRFVEGPTGRRAGGDAMDAGGGNAGAEVKALTRHLSATTRHNAWRWTFNGH